MTAPSRPLLSWLRAPWWLVQLATGAKSFVDNPLIGSRTLNRRGLHLNRVRLAHRLAWSRRRRLARFVSAGDKAAFDRDGFVEIRDFVPATDFVPMRDALLNGTFPAREHVQGNTITRRTAIGPAMLKSIPGLASLLASPRWRGLMHYVAATRAEPLYYLQTIIGGGEEAPSDPQVELHSDTFHPSLKAWLFLTDVDDRDCPLTYVAGSHRLNPAREKWERDQSLSVVPAGDRLSQRGSLRIDRTELDSLGLPRPHRFAVPANTLVVADTSGFHARAESDRPTVRVEIWAYCRRSPFLPWTGLDLLSLPWIAPRRAGWATRAVDWLDRRGWMKQHWVAVGAKRAMDR